MHHISMSCSFRQIRISILYIFTAFLFVISAQTHAATGSLSLQTVYDSGDSRDIFIDLSVALNNKTSFFLGSGNTKADESSFGAADDLDLDYWNIGISHKFTNTFTMALNVNTSGQDRDINTRDIDTKMTWSGKNWTFSLQPQFRKLELLFIPFLAPSRIIDINSSGVGTSLGYLGMENWEFFISFDKYKYDRDVRTLNIPFIINRISSKALTIASSVKDSSVRIDATRLYAESDITASYGQSKSAVDNSSLNVASLNMNFYQFYPVTVGIEVGSVDSKIDDASYYAGLTLAYSW